MTNNAVNLNYFNSLNGFKIKLWSFKNFRHRAVNIFVRSFYELWLQDENIGQEVMIEDLTVSFSFNQYFVLLY